MSTKVYGASDDLVEVEGDVDGEVTKFGSTPAKPIRLGFSDGTVLAWVYAPGTEGIWKVTVEHAGTLFDRVDECHEETDAGYSDVVHFRDGLTEATHGRSKVR